MAVRAFEPAFELCRERPSLLSSSASKFFFQRFIVAPTGVRLRRWLDNDFKDNDYCNYFISSWTNMPTTHVADNPAAEFRRGQRELAWLPVTRWQPPGPNVAPGLRSLSPERPGIGT